MGDALGVQSLDNAVGHAVVLSVDNVEVLAGVDGGLSDLAGFVGVPAVAAGTLADDGPVVGGFALLGQGIAAADLRGAAQLALDVQDLVLIQTEALKPCNGGLAFLAHVGNDGGSVQAGIALDHTVEQEDLDAGFLGFGQDFVPAGGLSSGNKDVFHAAGDKALGCFQLLVGSGSGDEGGVVAVFLGEGVVQILNVGLAIAGLGRIQVDDADLDQVAAGSGFPGIGGLVGLLTAGGQGEDQNQSEQQGDYFTCHGSSLFSILVIPNVFGFAIHIITLLFGEINIFAHICDKFALLYKTYSCVFAFLSIQNSDFF